MTEPNEIGGVFSPLSVNTVPPLEARDHIQGSTNATIVLMKYGDYQCLQSGQAHVTIKAIQQRLGEQLCFIVPAR